MNYSKFEQFQGRFKIFALFTITCMLTLIIPHISATPNVSYKHKYEKLLQNSYKSDIELIFDPIFDFHNSTQSDETIRKYYHRYKENEMNLINGARMKCYTPSKIKKNITRKESLLNETKSLLPDDLAMIFLRQSASLCYNSNFREWFYKLCPFKSAHQVLSYKKKNEKTGEEFTETWNLGQKESTSLNEFNPIEYYRKHTNDTSSVNLERNPFVIVEDRIAKIYNYDLSDLKKYELGLIIEYDLEELKSLNKPVVVNKYIKSVEDYLKEYPEATKIPLQRKMLKLVNKHLIILDGPFPIPKTTNQVNVNLIKQRITDEITTSFTLNVYGEYIYCFRCEFLTHYSVGDSLFIKNGRYSEVPRSSFTDIAYRSIRIVHIYDNQLLKVEEKFPKDLQGVILRNNYFVLDGGEKENNWINGNGSVKVKGKILYGLGSKFMSTAKKNDKILLFSPSKIQETFNISNTNPKVKINKETQCEVERVLTDNILITKAPCLPPLGHKGDYFISKPFYQFENDYYKITPENKVFSVVDFYTVETLNILKQENNFYHGQFLFHPGFMIRTKDNTAFRMKISKQINGPSFLRIIFGTDAENYKSRKVGEKDIELLINSDSGTLIKPVMDRGADLNNIEFYDTDIRSLFLESILIDIIFHNNSIYFNTIDDDNDSSIKVKYSLPDGVSIKYIYFDIKRSDNIALKDIRKINFVELKYLYNMFVYNMRSRLPDDAYYVEEFTGGDFCGAKKTYRKAHIEYRCDRTTVNEIYIEKVSEDRTCEYNYFVRSRHLCNPVTVMTSKIENSIAKTKCVAINKIYNDKDDLYL